MTHAQCAHKLCIFQADLMTLSLKAQNFHWHVKGPLFAVHHALFGEIYEEASGMIDDVAERVRALECDALSTFDEMLKIRTLKDGDKKLSGLEMIAALLKDYLALISLMKEAIPFFQKEGDEASADMFIGYVQSFEKRAWMLKMHLA